MKQYVLGLAFSEDKEEILLIKKEKPKWQRGLYNGIGGKIERYDDNPIDAMVREFKEECGIETSKDDWDQIGLMAGSFGKVFVFNYFGDISDYQSMESETVVKFSINVALHKDKIIPNVKTLICHCIDDANNYLKLIFD